MRAIVKLQRISKVDLELRNLELGFIALLPLLSFNICAKTKIIDFSVFIWRASSAQFKNA